MKQYLDLIKFVINNGFQHPDRTGNGRISVHGYQMRFDIKNTFPLITTKKVFLRGIIEELLWFLRGSTNNTELKDKKVNIWTDWEVKEEDVVSFVDEMVALAKKKNEIITDDQIEKFKEQARTYIGYVGNIYGAAWRNAPSQGMINPLKSPRQYYDELLSDKKAAFDSVLKDINKTIDELTDGQIVQLYMKLFPGVDQLAYIINELKTNPWSARHIVSAWIPEWVPEPTLSPEKNVIIGKAALSTCHCLFQFHVSPALEEGGKLRLSCQLYQRSVDTGLGLCYNISSYALLTMMIAQVVGMEPNEFIWDGGDVHIYPNHLEGLKEQLTREPRPLPKMILNPEIKDILQFKFEDFTLMDYDPHPAISFDIAK